MGQHHSTEMLPVGRMVFKVSNVTPRFLFADTSSIGDVEGQDGLATGDSTILHGRNPSQPSFRTLKRTRNGIQSILDALTLSIHPGYQNGGGMPVQVTWHRTDREASYNQHDRCWLSKIIDGCIAGPVTRIRVAVTTSSAPLP